MRPLPLLSLSSLSNSANFSRTGPEDFDNDAQGRCSRCIRQKVDCEREKPLRPRGGNPQRAVSACPPTFIEDRSSEQPQESAFGPDDDEQLDASFEIQQGCSADLQIAPDPSSFDSLSFASQAPGAYQPWASMVGFLEADVGMDAVHDPAQGVDWNYLLNLPTPPDGALLLGASPSSNVEGQDSSSSDVVPELSDEMAEACAFSLLRSSPLRRASLISLFRRCVDEHRMALLTASRRKGDRRPTLARPRLLISSVELLLLIQTHH